MDLRTRYTALVTLITQYVKFASETLKRTEDEEVTNLIKIHQRCFCVATPAFSTQNIFFPKCVYVFYLQRSVDEEKREHGDKVSKLLHWMSNVQKAPNNHGNKVKDSNANTETFQKPQVRSVVSTN